MQRPDRGSYNPNFDSAHNNVVVLVVVMEVKEQTYRPSN